MTPEIVRVTLNQQRHVNRAESHRNILESFGEPKAVVEKPDVHTLDRITLKVAGMLSPDDARRLKRRLARLDGVDHAIVRFRDEMAVVTVRDERVDAAGLQFVIESEGFGAWRFGESILSPEVHREKEHAESFHRAIKTLIPALVVFGISIAVRGLNLGSFWLQSLLTDAQLFFTLATFWFGRELFAAAARNVGWRSAAREVPLGLAASVAFGGSMVAFFAQSAPYFDVPAAIVAAYQVGSWIESWLLRRAEAHFHFLTRLRPQWAVVRRDDSDYRINIRDLIVEDKVVVPPGQLVPVDGVILNDGGVVDQSALMGEGSTVQKGSGRAVYAGSTNGEHELLVAPRRTGDATVLGHILRVVKDARNTRATVQQRGDRVAAIVAPITLILSAATFIGWQMKSTDVGDGFWSALGPALAVLVVTTPWALGWSSAVSVMAGMTRAARRGVLFRDAESLESIRNVDVMLFEKSGTLTSDRPEVETMEVVGDLTPSDAVRMIVALEQQSSHGVGQAFIRYAKEQLGPDYLTQLPVVQGVEIAEGRGILGRISGREIAVGTQQLLEDKFIAVPPLPPQSVPGTYYYLAVDNKVCVRALLYDPLRDDAVVSVKRAQAAGLRTGMLTSADVTSAEQLAASVGIAADDVYAQIDQSAHAEVTHLLRSAGYRVAVVGNSDSDQASLRAAHVAFALIPRGGRLPPERYAVSLLRPGSGGVVTAFDVASHTFRTIRRNIALSVCVMFCGIPAAMGVLPVHVATTVMLLAVGAVGIHGLRT